MNHLPSIHFLLLCISGIFSTLPSRAQSPDDTANFKGIERPFIWVQASERDALLAKIENEAWAGDLFEQMRERVEPYVDRHQTDPSWFLSRVQLTWSGPNYTHTEYDNATESFISSGDAEHPTLRFLVGRMPRTPAGEALRVPDFADLPPFNPHPTGGMILKRQSDGQPFFIDYIDRYIRDIHREMLEMAVDSSMIYWITGEEKYAVFAADVLSIFIEALYPTELVRGDRMPQHNWGIISGNHLLEARWFSNLLPVIYDFVYPYLDQNPMIYDAVRKERRPFHHEHAQEVFRKYITLALERGILDCNWVVFEAASMLHSTLALNDATEREKYLRYFFDTDTPRQQSLETFMQFFTEEGVWFESISYAEETTAFIAYLFTLVDRLMPEEKLPERYPVIFEAPHILPKFRFPNGEYIVFGDSHRDIHENPLTYELLYVLAQEHGLSDATKDAGGAIQRMLVDGTYDRSEVERQSFVYYQPVKLLWFTPEVTEEAAPVIMNRTESMHHAGVILQRNGDSAMNGMMTWMGGGHHVHAAASGIHMEIYGLGQVVGVGSGRDAYGTPLHVEYMRNYASHNTVIVNNASRGAGGWDGIGHELVELQSAEPSPGESGVSAHHSFATTRFVNNYGVEMKEADQLRTMALIRTSEKTGYYVDIFRSRTREDDPRQTHDYIYHNFGHALSLQGDFKVMPPPAWFGAHLGDINSQPGTHWFEPILASEVTDASLRATFRMTLDGVPSRTEVRMVGNAEMQSMKAISPKTADAPSPYRNQPTPTLIVRRVGEAWTQPFVATYEVFEHATGSSVQSVEQLDAPIGITQVKVKSALPNGDRLEQIIFVTDGGPQLWEDANFSVKAHFAIYTLRNGTPDSLYIGEGADALVAGQSIAFPLGAFSVYVDLKTRGE